MSDYIHNEINSNKKITKGIITSYIVIALNIIAGFLFTPWMIQNLGKDNYGLYTVAISFISLFMIDFGLGTALSKFIANYAMKKDHKSINNLISIIFRLYLVLDIIIIIILSFVYIFLDQIYVGLTPEQLIIFKNIYIIISIFSIISFPFLSLNGILIAYENFFELKIADVINKLLTILLIVLALLMGYGLYALVLINMAIGIVTIVYKLIIINRKSKIELNLRYKDTSQLKQIFSYSIWATVIMISQRFIFNITPTILGIVATTSMIAIFGVASAIEGYLYVFAYAMNGFFLPKITRIYVSENSQERVFNLFVRVGRFQLMLISLIIVGFILVGREFIHLWMNPTYDQVYLSSILLMLPSLFYLPQQIGNSALIVKNKLHIQAYVFIGMAVINLILSFTLSYYFGVIGASLSICIAYLFRTIGMNVIYKSVLKLDLLKYYKETYCPMILPILIILIIGITLNILFDSYTWLNLFIKIALITIFFTSSLWLFTMSKFEKGLIVNNMTILFQRFKMLMKKNSR